MKTGAGDPLFGGKLGANDQGPVINALLNDFSVKLIGGLLEGVWIGHANEPIVVLGKGNVLTRELAVDEVVPVEIGGDLEGEKRSHPQNHRAEHLIEDVEVIMGVATFVFAQELEIRIGGGNFGGKATEGPALLHALEDVIDAELFSSDHAKLPGTNQILFADSRIGPDQRQLMVAGELLDPGLVVACPLQENLLGDFGLFADFPEKINDVVLAR